ncbi:MAG TPA: HEAT repeat domain-containing protein [Candidatus Binatia bacterium]|jgi:HEAT repeat protein
MTTVRFSTALRSLLAAAAVAATLAPAPARAQDEIRTNPAVERYNKTAKGKNVEDWKKRLTDPDVKTRLDAVDSLGTKGGDDAVKPLIDATADADYRVRTRAIDYLGTLKATEATQVLMQLLFLTDVGREEKLRALTALGRIGDPTTSDRLASYARTINDNDLACRAVYALGEIGDLHTKDKISALTGTRPGTELDRLVEDALLKIDQKEDSKPIEQPTLIELERRVAKQQEAADKKAQQE